MIGSVQRITGYVQRGAGLGRCKRYMQQRAHVGRAYVGRAKGRERAGRPHGSSSSCTDVFFVLRLPEKYQYLENFFTNLHIIRVKYFSSIW